MRQPRRFLTALILLATITGLGTFATASAAEAPAQMSTSTTIARPLDPQAVSTAIGLNRSRVKLDQLDRALNTAQAEAASANTALQLVVSSLGAAKENLERVRTRARERAVVAYQQSGVGYQSLASIAHASDLSAAQHYTQAAVDVDDTELANMTVQVGQLEAERDDKQYRLQQTQQDQADLQRQVDNLTAESKQDQDRLDEWGAVPVMGNAWVTAAQLADWYRSTGAVPNLAAGTTVDDLARLYIIEGNAEHVRGDLAFAQAIIETGSFSVAAGNNYSGIGVCDSCTGGYSFPTPLDGVRAQVQLLRNYADPDSRAANLANSPSPSLYGNDPAKATKTYDAFFLKGKAPLWNVMGNGNWATDPGYATEVIDMFARIVAYAAGHPG